MLEDPEAESTDTVEEVRAKTVADARRKCEFIASVRTQEGGTLVTVQGEPQQLTRTPSKNGTYRFLCSFRGEL